MRRSLLLFVALIFSGFTITGCGQNPHVTGSDPATSTSQASGSSTPAETTPQAAPTQTQNPTNNSDQTSVTQTNPDTNQSSNRQNDQTSQNQVAQNTDQNHDSNNRSTDTSNSDRNNNNNNSTTNRNTTTNNTDRVVTENTTITTQPQPTVINGRDGNNGQDGRNGRDGQDNCLGSFAAFPPVTTAFGPLDLNNLASQLPYLPSVSSAHRSIHLDLRSLSQTNFGRGSTRRIRNAEVVFGINIHLPPRSSIIANTSVAALLRLNIRKVSRRTEQRFDDTEAFCSLDTQTCSGNPFHTDSRASHNWAVLANSSFGGGHGFINTIFSDNLREAIRSSSQVVRGDVRIWTQEDFTLDLAQVLAPQSQGSTAGRLSRDQLLDYLYGANANPNAWVDRTLRFVVVDDTEVRGATLTIQASYNTCQVVSLTQTSSNSGGH